MARFPHFSLGRPALPFDLLQRLELFLGGFDAKFDCRGEGLGGFVEQLAGSLRIGCPQPLF
jgi:hypothetical protein